MPFGQHPSIGPGQRNPHRTSVLELERHVGTYEIRRKHPALGHDRPFDAMQTRDRQPGAFSHPLITVDSIPNLADRATTNQLAHPGARLDEAERRLRHALIVSAAGPSRERADAAGAVSAGLQTRTLPGGIRLPAGVFR